MDVEVWQHFEDSSAKLSKLEEEPAGEIRNAEISQIAEDVCKEIEKNHKALAQDVSCGSNDEAIVLRIRAQVQALNPELAGRIDQAVKGLHDEIATIEQSVEQSFKRVASELGSLVNNPANDDAHIQEVGRFLNKNLSWFRGRSSDGVVLHDRQIAELFTGLDNLRLKAEKSSSQYAEKLLKYIDTLSPTFSKKTPLDLSISSYKFLISKEGLADGTLMLNVRNLIKENPEEGYNILRDIIEGNYKIPLNEFGLTEEELNHIAPDLINVNLRDFDFSEKNELEIHSFIEKFKNMKKLEINKYDLQSLPLIVRQLESLTCGALESLTHLPDGMNFLKFLSVQSCSNLKELPEDLHSLEELRCGLSGLVKLPNNLKNLKKLDCWLSNFTKLPEDLDSLEDLNCGVCRSLKQLPNNLKYLKILRCGMCEMLVLPRGMVSLESLACPPDMELPQDLPRNVIVKRVE